MVEDDSIDSGIDGDAAREPSQKEPAALRARLLEQVDAVVTAEGYELVDLQLASDRGGAIVRLFVDTVPPSDAARGVSIEDCTHVSRRVGAALDADDPMPGEYRLEVSSPGLFRPLTKPEHFERALGERVKVKTFERLGDRKVFIGTLTSADEERLVVAVDGTDFEVPLASIAKANLEPLI